MNSSNLEDSVVDTDYEYFKQEFEKLSTIQLDYYKEKQMKRRINTLMERKGMSEYESFLNMLRWNPSELAAFVDYITINVTEFFRTPDQWAVFEETVLSELIRRKNGPLKVWSCACSTGEEVYSLAMSLWRHTNPSNFRILATDIDEKVLKKAEDGIFDARAVESLSEEALGEFFKKTGDKWTVKEELKQCITFRKLDLLRDDYPSDCDVIVCRNVLIYFTEDGKKQIYEKFLESLKPDGYLFTGNTEQIIYFKAFGFRKIKNYIYQKEQ